MNPSDLVAGLIAALLALWLFGGAFARLGGLLLVLVGLAGLALGPSGAGPPLTIVSGALLWLVGHLHYAVRHHCYKSPLARYVFCRWLPPRLDPTRKWALPVDSRADSRPRHRHKGRKGEAS